MPERKAIMSAKEFFGKRARGRAREGKVGVETEWLGLGHIELRAAGKIHVVDPIYFGNVKEGCLIGLQKGRYEVEVKCLEFGWDRRVSRFRMALRGVQSQLGRKVDEAFTDTASVTIANAAAAVSTSDKQREEMYEAIGEALAGVSRVNQNLVVYVASGFGDGRFPVHQRLDGDRKICGFEIEFIPQNAPYPFKSTANPQLEEEENLDRDIIWIATKHLRDEAWKAMTKGNAKARAFFKTLTPGQRAFLAIDYFQNLVRFSGSAGRFFVNEFGAAVTEEVLAGYKLLGAKEHYRQFKVLFDLAHPYSLHESFEDRMCRYDRVERGESGKALRALTKWFIAKRKSDPIDVYMRRYVNAHPEDFPSNWRRRGGRVVGSNAWRAMKHISKNAAQPR